MKLNFGDYYYLGGQIYFNSDKNLQIYNKHILNLQDLANKELEIGKKASEKTNKFLNKLKNF